MSVSKTILDWTVEDEYVCCRSAGVLGFFDGNLVDGLAYDFISATVWNAIILVL